MYSTLAAVPQPRGTLTFDETFARLVRIVGLGLGVWAVATKRLDGTETVTLILAFVGFEFVTRFRDSKLKQLEKRRED
jgi:hypothetical protein